MSLFDVADFASARHLMQDNMVFEGPLDTFNKADDYLAANKKLSSIIQRVDLKKVFVDDDDVCVLYEMVTNTPVSSASTRSACTFLLATRNIRAIPGNKKLSLLKKEKPLDVKR